MFKGLNSSDVIERRKKFGKNEIPQPKFGFLKLVLRQVKSIFIVILFAAAFITFLLEEYLDAIFILVFVLAGVSLGVYQEFKSNSAAEKLKTYLIRKITVRRNAEEQEVLVTDLVPGDILKLETGDMIPADAEIVETTGLLVDETTFTGESIPVAKGEEEKGEDNKLLQGTIIIRGLAYAKVTKTGTETRLAKIAKTAISTTGSVSELTKGVDRISYFVMWTTLITLTFVILANIIIKGGDTDIPHLLVFAIALAISVIPEILPLVVTFSLSRGALKLAKNSVIVKKLTAVQDLGMVDLLCTDKTGTITENKLTFKNDYLIPESAWHPLVLSSLVAHNLNKRIPEPFDLATENALNEEQRKIVDNYLIIEQEPFDPSLRSNGSKVKSKIDGSEIHIRRGSPEYFFEQGLVERDVVKEWLLDEERQGRRVLGLSYNDGSGAKFAGFISFVDSLKESTKETLALAKELNVAVTIITGDSLLVAEAVGRETGLVSNKREVVEATEFFSFSVEKQQKLIGKIRVFARTTPEQKLSLILLLKEKYTVGFLGEGINDTAALKASDVSLVVESASDVARELSDIVLMESDLRVIIDGIKYGRETYANTLKYIRITLASNFGNFYAVAIGSLLITFLPMLPKQILLLNLLSDIPMLAIAFDRVGKEEVSHPQKYEFKSMYAIFITLGLVSTIFDFMWFGLFYKEGPEILQTNWFIASVLTEIVLFFSLRTMLPIEKGGRPAPIIVWISAVTFILTILIPLIPITAKYFEFTTPSLNDMFLIVSLTAVYFIASELAKRFLARFLEGRKTV